MHEVTTPTIRLINVLPCENTPLYPSAVNVNKTRSRPDHLFWQTVAVNAIFGAFLGCVVPYPPANCTPLLSVTFPIIVFATSNIVSNLVGINRLKMPIAALAFLEAQVVASYANGGTWGKIAAGSFVYTGAQMIKRAYHVNNKFNLG